MQKKILLLATFVNPNFLNKTLSILNKKFNLDKKDIFFFDMGDEMLITYRLIFDIDQSIDIKKDLRKTIQIHKKNNTFFTINALNKLIERDFSLPPGNVDYKKYTIDWQKYENSLIILRDEKIEILPLKRNLSIS
jgi:hypothetical protein